MLNDKGAVFRHYIFGFMVAVTLLISGCKKQHTVSREGASWQWPVMGTVASLTVCGGERDAALVMAKAAVEAVNAQLSVFDSASDVGQINAAAGTDRLITIQPHTHRVLDASIQYYRDSHGAFNPLVGPLMETWGFSRGGEIQVTGLPSSQAIEAAQRLSDARRLERGDGGTVRLLDRGMKLDFGAIAKGYAVDVAFERLHAAGYTNMLINLGGNMRVSGVPSSARQAWRIAVRNPQKKLSDTPLGVVLLGDGRALATSGSYEQYLDWEGTRYSHIMDARTGSPVTGVLQVTVLAPTAMAADALSTTYFILGAEQGMADLAGRPGCEALFIVDDGDDGFSMMMTAGFRCVFKQEASDK